MIIWVLGLAGIISCALSAVHLLVLAAPLWALLTHVVGAVLCAAAAVRLRHPVRGSGLFEYVAALAIPSLGGLLILLHALGERFGVRQGAAEDFAAYIDPVSRLGEERLPEVRRGLIPSPAYLAPIIDVLQSGATDDEKRNAIEGLARLESPEAVDTLRTALVNESPDIRFYAASVLSRMEERLAQRVKALDDAMVHGEQTDADLDLEKARTFFDYAYLRLAEDVRRADYLERAVTCATAAVQSGADPSGWVVAGRALMELHRYQEAEEMFTRYLDAVGENVKGLLWRAEARFYLGQYRKVREDCARALRFGEVSETVAQAAKLWT